jgi:hypothetical protein
MTATASRARAAPGPTTLISSDGALLWTRGQPASKGIANEGARQFLAGRFARRQQHKTWIGFIDPTFDPRNGWRPARVMERAADTPGDVMLKL